MKNIYSNLKIFEHPEKLYSIRKGWVTEPISIRIKPTNRCNNACFYCGYEVDNYSPRSMFRRGDEIPWHILQGVIEDIYDMSVKSVILSGGGEPLIYPHIEELIQMILDRNIDLGIITNGLELKGHIAELLTEAKWIRISCDSAKAPTYSKIRGVSKESFYDVCRNISSFAKNKPDTCVLGINCVINHMNKSEILRIGYLFKHLGVDHIKFAPCITNNTYSYHKKFRRKVIGDIYLAQQELNDNSFRIIDAYTEGFDEVLNRDYDKCRIMQIIPCIGADSKVYTCHDKAYVPNGVIGDLKKQTFKDIWFSDKTKKMFENFNPEKECKHHCVYDNRNKLINKYLDMNYEHRNFI